MNMQTYPPFKASSSVALAPCTHDYLTFQVQGTGNHLSNVNTDDTGHSNVIDEPYVDSGGITFLRVYWFSAYEEPGDSFEIVTTCDFEFILAKDLC